MTFVDANFSGPTTVAGGTTSSPYTIAPQFPISHSYTPQDGGFGGTFTPPVLTWVSDATPKTFVYNAPNLSGMIHIAPVSNVAGPVTDPPYINVNVTGTNAAQHIYYFPQQGGVPPFQVLQTNNQIPGASLPFVSVPQHIYYFPMQAGVPPFQIIQTNFQIAAGITPPPPAPSVTTYGTIEAGGGIIISLAAGASVVLMGPIQTPVRQGLRDPLFVSATGAFNLDYQYTTDGGTSWFVGSQVPSSTVSADGTLNTQAAHIHILSGFQWKIIITNTGAGTIDAVFEKRLHDRGMRSI